MIRFCCRQKWRCLGVLYRKQGSKSAMVTIFYGRSIVRMLLYLEDYMTWSSLLNFRETRCYHNLFCSMNWLRLRRKNVLTLVQFKFISIKFINRLINTQFSRKSHRNFQIFSHIWPIHLGNQWFWIISFIYFCWPFIRLGCW